MSQFDLSTLPAPLGAYFTSGDRSSIVGLFAPDAHVRDEGHDHHGTAAIAAWLDSVETRYQPRYVIETAETDGNRTVATVVVTGTFPGSPVTMRQQFTIHQGKIASFTVL